MKQAPVKEENYNNAILIWLPEAIAVVLAIIALRKGNSYGYYVFLRWVACPVFIWIGWRAYARGFGIVMVISAGVLAVLFNLILRVTLERNRWEILNIVMVAVAIWSAAVSLKTAKSQM